MTDQSIERVEEPVPPTPGRLHLMAFIATPEQRALCTCKPDKQEGYHKRDCPTVIAALKRFERPAPQADRCGMTQSCNTCIHRPYGESRFHIDCMIYEPFWSRKKPHPKSFGAKCQRYEAPAPSGLESSSEHPAKHEQSQ